jgi:hypothetical protein
MGCSSTSCLSSGHSAACRPSASSASIRSSTVSRRSASNPIGLQAFVPDFESKAKSLTAALADGRLLAIQGVARAV